MIDIISDERVYVRDKDEETYFSIVDAEYNLTDHLLIYSGTIRDPITKVKTTKMYVQSYHPVSGNLNSDYEAVKTDMALAAFNNGPEWGNCEGSETYIYYARQGDSKDVIARTRINTEPGIIDGKKLAFILESEEIVRIDDAVSARNCGPVIPAFNNPPMFSEPLVVYLLGNKLFESDLRVFNDPGPAGDITTAADTENLGRLTFLGGMASFPIRIIPQSRAFIWTTAISATKIKVECRDIDSGEILLTLGEYCQGELVSVGATLAPAYDDVAGLSYVFYAVVNRGYNEDNIRGEVDSWFVRSTSKGGFILDSGVTIRPRFGDTVKYLVDDESFSDGNGFPFISTVVGNSIEDNPEKSEVWLISLSGMTPYGILAKRISQSHKERVSVKKDPEVVILEEKIYVYYLDGLKDDEGKPDQLSLWRADTGLSAQPKA